MDAYIVTSIICIFGIILAILCLYCTKYKKNIDELNIVEESGIKEENKYIQEINDCSILVVDDNGKTITLIKEPDIDKSELIDISIGGNNKYYFLKLTDRFEITITLRYNNKIDRDEVFNILRGYDLW